MPRPLTFEERVAVRLALKGESFNHRHWPREVTRALSAADVVPAKTLAANRAPLRERLLAIPLGGLPRRVMGLYLRLF
jgi:hypothetical protein